MWVSDEWSGNRPRRVRVGLPRSRVSEGRRGWGSLGLGFGSGTGTDVGTPGQTRPLWGRKRRRPAGRDGPPRRGCGARDRREGPRNEGVEDGAAARQFAGVGSEGRADQGTRTTLCYHRPSTNHRSCWVTRRAEAPGLLRHASVGARRTSSTRTKGSQASGVRTRPGKGREDRRRRQWCTGQGRL